MAGVAYYNTGTATVAANSKTVTGTGTNWLSEVGGLTAVKKGDKFGIHVGRPILIASVDSNTQLTLEDNWPGPAQTNAAYRIELTSPDVIAVDALRRMLGSLSSGVLYGISQLPSTPSKALTIDENGAAALSDLGATGKSLLAALNGSAAYGVLGTIPNAQLPTRLREFSTAVTDANAATSFGSYAVAANAANIPEAAAGTLFVVPQTSGVLTAQTYTRISSGAVWKRTQTASGTWATWRKTPFAQTALTDTASDAAMLVGAFGLGGVGTALTTMDNLNSLPAITSFYRWGSTTLPVNAPDGGTSVMLQIQHSAGGASQVAFNLSATGSVIWTRKQASTSWTSWSRIPIAQTSTADTTAGAAMVVGAFGLGSGNGVRITSTSDLNSLPTYTAFYSWLASSAPSNAPSVTQSCTMVNLSFTTGATTQIAYSVNSNLAWMRIQSGSFGWTDWKRIDGDVSGPATSVNNFPVAFDGTTGKLIKQITGAIAALHALTPAADRLPFFSGASSADLAVLTSFARSILDDTSGAAMFATMGATQNLAASGYTKLPNGLIIQWGKGTSTGGNATIAFPMAFPNAVFSVTASCQAANPTTTVLYAAWADTFTLTNFVLRGRYVVPSGVAGENLDASFIAIGY